MNRPKMIGNVLWHARLALISLCVCFTAASAFGMQNPKVRVVETIWGFDGRIVSGQFQPVSLLLDNLSEDAVEGELRLRSSNAMMQSGGSVLTESIYLGPRSRRWVQLYPYISQYTATWQLTLNVTGEVLLSEEIDQPRLAMDSYSTGSSTEPLTQIAVILDRSQGVQNRSPTSVKHMPEEIFPPYVTATAGLRVLYLDHVPNWELPRQESLLGWLRTGGQLHLLQDTNSERPKFEGVLSVLNEPRTVFSVGSGTVIQHDFQRDGLSEELVAQHVRPQVLTEAPEEIQANSMYQSEVSVDGISIDSEILLGLRELTRPEHNWFLIFLLSICYIGLIFPGSWLISRVRTIHYLATYGAIIAAAVVFSGLFLFIGQRGYGESTVQHCMTTARHLNGNQWNAAQWATLFVTTGDRYVISSKDEQAMFAVGGLDDTTGARIHSGNLAELSVRIPPFSSQAMLSRRVVTMDDWAPVVGESEIGQAGIVKLSLNVNQSIPRGEKVIYHILHDNFVYNAVLSDKDGQLTLTAKESLGSMFTYCTSDPLNNMYNRRISFFGFSNGGTEEEREAAFLDKCLRQMLHKSIVDDGATRLRDWKIPSDRIRLCVFAPVDDRQKLPLENAVNLEGRTLFMRDVVLTGP